MATVKKAKKYQGGGSMDPKAAAILKAKAAKDTTQRFTKEDQLDRINAITAGKIKPFVDKASVSGTGKSKDTKYGVVNGKDTTYMSKGDFESKYGGKKKSGGPVKKAKSGGSFPDLNKDGKVTKADILKGRGVIAKKGAMIKKAGKAIVAKKMVKSIKKK